MKLRQPLHTALVVPCRHQVHAAVWRYEFGVGYVHPVALRIDEWCEQALRAPLAAGQNAWETIWQTERKSSAF